MNQNATTDSPRRGQAPEPFKAPHTFLPKLTYIAAVSAAIILALTGFGVWSIVSHYVILFAEKSSVNITAALSSRERDSLFTTTPRGQRRLVPEIPPDRLEQIDARIRPFLKAFDIVKIKVYTRDGRIIYSTDRGIIGERDLANRRLVNALSGRVDAELAHKGRVQDLADESKLAVDVVETYVPIYDNRDVIGCFEVYMDVSRYRGEIRQIVTIAIVVIVMITLVVYGVAFVFHRRTVQKLKEAENTLQRYAASDPLTGLHNRRHIFVRARQELSRLQRETEHENLHALMSVTMVDLDHFKKVNDAYGHLVGDEVLKETARRIQATTRTYDLVGRLGGEEFVIVHPDADYMQAKGIAGRIWQAIRQEPYVIEGKKIMVAASLGVATLDPSVEKDITPALQRADRALYSAKRAGRDRVG
jgi:diguanylate cyclase (GGDEF)-like protein